MLSTGRAFQLIRNLSLSSKNLASTTNQSKGVTLQETASQSVTKQENIDGDLMRVERPLLYHDQMEWLDERLVRISKPTKNVMQSGTAYTNSWKIDFDCKPRGEYWLMGWTSTADPLSNSSLSFPTKEAAISFCETNKLQWFVEEQPERKVRKKSYADNYSWNKRTRSGTK